MGTPGFVAEYSLYKSRVHYYAAAALAQAAGATLQDFSLPVAPGGPVRRAPLAPSGSSCDPVCVLDDTGACVRNCIYCTPHQPIDECQEFTQPCNSCCPSGRDPCYAPHKAAHFCCPPEKPHCCDSQTNFCCAEQCCFDAGYYCCRDSEYCCAGACCSQGSACCNGNCTPLGTNQNCGGCGDDCRTSTTGKTCLSGQCRCPSGLSPCGNSCCPPEQCCNGVCKDLKSDPKNCGTCGRDCNTSTTGRTCVGGQCKCTYPLSGCGVCTNLKSDPKNCGTCGSRCAPGQMCSNGKCLSMPSGCPGANKCGIYCCQENQFCCLSDDGRDGKCCDFAMWSGCEGAECAYLH
jgi:hypothetical protein